MTFTQLLQNPRFRSEFIKVSVFAAVFFFLNIFLLGNSDSYKLLNNLLPPTLAILVSLQVFNIWGDSSQDKTARRVWTYLLAGMVLWAMGDLIWAFYALILQIDVPYPSWADAIWISGYFFLFVGLYAQFRAYNTPPGQRVWLSIVVFALVLIALTGYFVLWPIIQSFDSDRLLESLLNIFYPMLDLVLLPLCFLILGTLGEGKLAVSWKIITVGFMIRAVSDLIFAYITWQEIYMPDGKANLVSAAYDFIYAMSYPVAGLGFAAYRFLMVNAPAVEGPAVAPEPGPTGNFILVSTDGANRIISYSDNLLPLLQRNDEENIKGASLYELLIQDAAVAKTFETELLQQGVVDALPAQVTNANGKNIDVQLFALAVYYEGKSFKGANIVINTLAPLGMEDGLSQESQAMVRSILSRTSNPQRETRAALSIYFNTHMRMLDDLVHQYGGKTIAHTMRMAINDAALKNGWQVRKEGADFVILDQHDLDVLAVSMSALLAAARTYATNMVSSQLVNVEIDNLNALMNPAVMNAVDKYNIRLDGSPPE
jgi:hypothetical protein